MSVSTAPYMPGISGDGANIQAGPSQKIWDKALECFNKNYPSVPAIQEVWRAAPPPGDLATVAAAISAIYADTYWSLTRFNWTTLAAELHAATSQNQTDCDQVAQRAFQQWRGLLVRSSMSDNGAVIPKGDPVTMSPDVVVNGLVELPVPQLISMWNQYDYGPVKGKNYTYGRAQSVNMQVPIQKPVLRMYYSDAGFNPPPSSFVQLYTYEDRFETSPLQGMDPKATAIQPGGRAANSLAFGCELPGVGHYCMIAVAGSEFFTNNPLEKSGNWNSSDWMHCNGAAGWHNVDKTLSTEESFKFYNQDPYPERFIFEAHCSRVPNGTRLSLECSDTGMTYPLGSGDVRIFQDYQVVTAEAEVPPNFAGTLRLRYQTPQDGLLPEGSAIDVRMGWIIPQGHARYLHAAERLGSIAGYTLGHPMTIPMGNFTLLGTV